MHGQVRSALLSYELPSDSSPTQELSISTDNETNWLDHLILHLQTRRALIQQKNTQHSAILRLFSEILAEIFVFTNAVDETSRCLFPVSDVGIHSHLSDLGLCAPVGDTLVGTLHGCGVNYHSQAAGYWNLDFHLWKYWTSITTTWNYDARSHH